MAKTVEQIEKALKLKAQPNEATLSIKVGVKKFTLPFDVRILKSNEFMFVHIPPNVGLFNVSSGEVQAISDPARAEEAVRTFRKSRARRGAVRPEGEVDVPEELKAALARIPEGYKLVTDKKGTRLVRTRVRRSTK